MIDTKLAAIVYLCVLTVFVGCTEMAGRGEVLKDDGV
jgi:hypothetical protein